MRKLIRCCLMGMCAAAACAGCTSTSRLAVLSDGNLAGRDLTAALRVQQQEGEDCGLSYYLANAFREAVKGTPYDTLVDVEVTSTAGLTPFQQCLRVTGWGVRSADLPQIGARP
jgi:hypothetical protein